MYACMYVCMYIRAGRRSFDYWTLSTFQLNTWAANNYYWYPFSISYNIIYISKTGLKIAHCHSFYQLSFCNRIPCEHNMYVYTKHTHMKVTKLLLAAVRRPNPIDIMITKIKTVMMIINIIVDVLVIVVIWTSTQHHCFIVI